MSIRPIRITGYLPGNAAGDILWLKDQDRARALVAAGTAEWAEPEAPPPAPAPIADAAPPAVETAPDKQIGAGPKARKSRKKTTTDTAAE